MHSVFAPLARLVSWAVAGVEPERMGIGPVPAGGAGRCAGGARIQGHRSHRAQRGRSRAGARLHRRLVVEAGRFRAHDVNGSAFRSDIPLRDGRAHSGDNAARARSPQGAVWLETMCIGGGQGLAAVFERVRVSRTPRCAKRRWRRTTRARNALAQSLLDRLGAAFDPRSRGRGAVRRAKRQARCRAPSISISGSATSLHWPMQICSPRRRSSTSVRRASDIDSGLGLAFTADAIVSVLGRLQGI